MVDIENVIIIDDQLNFKRSIEKNKAVIAHFNSLALPECKNIIAIFHKLAKKNPGLTVLDIDILQNQKFFRTFNVSKPPYFILYANGKKLIDVCGIDEKFFKEWLPKMMPTINLEGFKIESK